jgi:predicted transcriptional regulator
MTAVSRTVRLPAELDAAVVARAKFDRCTPSDVCRRAIAAYVNVELVESEPTSPEVARALEAAGLTQRQIAELLGVTPQRVSQLLKEDR